MYPPRRLTSSLSAALVSIAMDLFATGAFAQAQGADELAPVVVSASRTEQRVMDTAASIDVVGQAQIRDGQAGFNLSEPLARTPGLVALNRQNYAQDLLISSRGFGANSTFGARGIRIIVDGIPGTMADGQGQISHVDLPSAERIEVLRGPFSTLYGNSAGGVISVFTADGQPGLHLTPYGSIGSFGQRKSGLTAEGGDTGLRWLIDAGQLHTDGYRDHSAANRDNENAKLVLRPGVDSTLTLIANKLSLSAQDPLGLTAQQLRTNRQAAGTGALTYDTRKSVDQIQGGLVFSHRASVDDTVTVSVYTGDRTTAQYLAAAANGVIRLDRHFAGVNGQWRHAGELATMPYSLVGGVEYNQNDDHRRAFSNTAGQQTGSPTQDFTMGAGNGDSFLQGELRPTERLGLSAGVRTSLTTMGSQDNIRMMRSPGDNTWHATTGMASIQYDLREDTRAYVSVGTGFDTPTLNQVFYSAAYVANPANANTGNIGLQAAATRQVELGLKHSLAGGGLVTFALFDASTANEVVVDVANAGKTAFTNAPSTHRQGAELAALAQLSETVRASIGAAIIDARVSQGYTGYGGTVVPMGNRIPGVPGQTLFTELMWRAPDRSLEFAAEARAAATIAANDVNGAWSGGYGVVALRTVVRHQIGGWTITGFARVDNLFDRAYVGSVIVNQSASQFYESAPGRNWMTGVRASWNFR
jgi:iron complex outermembrane receptor protein